MNNRLRLERVKAKITILSVMDKNEGIINFTSEDHMKRFADFNWIDGKGNESIMFKTLVKAFDEDRWVVLVLERKDFGRDWVKRVE